jgi:hypothetical protein
MAPFFPGIRPGACLGVAETPEPVTKFTLAARPCDQREYPPGRYLNWLDILLVKRLKEVIERADRAVRYAILKGET